MSAAAYVGRVGGLAVALGVGAALFTGTGLAWADPDASTSSDSPSSESPRRERQDARCRPAARTRRCTDGGTDPKAAEPKDERKAADEKGLDEKADPRPKPTHPRPKLTRPRSIPRPSAPPRSAPTSPTSRPTPISPPRMRIRSNPPPAQAPAHRLPPRRSPRSRTNVGAGPSVAQAPTSKVTATELTSAEPQPDGESDPTNTQSKVIAPQAMASLARVQAAATPVGSRRCGRGRPPSIRSRWSRI